MIFTIWTGKQFTVMTDGSSTAYNYAWFVHHRPYATFKLRACSNAQIVLSTNPYVTNMASYEIILGTENNQKSIIKLTTGESKTFNTPYILDCENARTFWIKWDIDISVGVGIPFNNPIIRWNPPGGYFINAMSVVTKDTPGEWTFEKDFGMFLHSFALSH